jgi:hypothetical protein
MEIHVVEQGLHRRRRRGYGDDRFRRREDQAELPVPAVVPISVVPLQIWKP